MAPLIQADLLSKQVGPALVTAQGQPVEFFLTPSADSDMNALKQYGL